MHEITFYYIILEKSTGRQSKQNNNWLAQETPFKQNSYLAIIIYGFGNTSKMS